MTNKFTYFTIEKVTLSEAADKLNDNRELFPTNIEIISCERVYSKISEVYLYDLLCKGYY